MMRERRVETGLRLLIGACLCAALVGCPDLDPIGGPELGPTIPPATGGDGEPLDDDDAAPDDDDAAPDDDDAVPTDDDDAVPTDDDDGADGPVAPCGDFVTPSAGSSSVAVSVGEALVTADDGRWLGCEARRFFGDGGAFVCEHWWQVTGDFVGGNSDGDVYRLDFVFVPGLSSCSEEGADYVLRYAVQALPEGEANLYASEPLGEPLWFWMSRAPLLSAPDGSWTALSYRTSFEAW
jgi:hypothetical protein